MPFWKRFPIIDVLNWFSLSRLWLRREKGKLSLRKSLRKAINLQYSSLHFLLWLNTSTCRVRRESVLHDCDMAGKDFRLIYLSHGGVAPCLTKSLIWLDPLSHVRDLPDTGRKTTKCHSFHHHEMLFSAADVNKLCESRIVFFFSQRWKR